MKKLLLLLLITVQLSFTPTLDELDTAINYYSEIGLVTFKLNSDTIEYSKNDTIFLLKLDKNYLP